MTDGNPLREASEVRSSITDIKPDSLQMDHILSDVRAKVREDVKNRDYVSIGILYGRNVTKVTTACDTLDLVHRVFKECIQTTSTDANIADVFKILEHSIQLLKSTGVDIDGEKFNTAMLAFVAENKSLA